MQAARTFSCRIVDFAVVNMHKKICWCRFFSIQIAQEKLYKNSILFCAKCRIYKFWKYFSELKGYSWYFYTHSKILHVMICVNLHVIYFYTQLNFFIVECSIYVIFIQILKILSFYHTWVFLYTIIIFYRCGLKEKISTCYIFIFVKNKYSIIFKYWYLYINISDTEMCLFFIFFLTKKYKCGIMLIHEGVN